MTLSKASTVVAFALATVLTTAVFATAQAPAAVGPDTSVSTLLDLAKSYVAQGRFDDALRVLQTAMVTIRQQQLAAGGGLVPAATALRVGGDIKVPIRLVHVPPVYPDAARADKVQGRVILEAIINEEGDVTNIRILRSLPMLEQAAVDAVSQWKYTPTLVADVAVPVIMTVTVDFTLP